jgi:hypothetical protein
VGSLAAHIPWCDTDASFWSKPMRLEISLAATLALVLSAAPAFAAGAPQPPPSSQKSAADALAGVLGLQQQEPETTATHMANTLISVLDKDGDGKLNAKEIGAALKQAGDTASDEDVASAISKVDGNGDGLITADELAGALQQQLNPSDDQHHHHGHHHGGHGVHL